MSEETMVERFENAEVRLEKVVSFGMCSDWNALSDAAEEILEDLGQLIKETGIEFQLVPSWLEENDEEDVADIAQRLFLAGYIGIFAQFAQPIMEKSTVGLRYSWGRYRMRWFYGETLERCALTALEWAEANQESTRKAVPA